MHVINIVVIAVIMARWNQVNCLVYYILKVVVQLSSRRKSLSFYVAFSLPPSVLQYLIVGRLNKTEVTGMWTEDINRCICSRVCTHQTICACMGKCILFLKYLHYIYIQSLSRCFYLTYKWGQWKQSKSTKDRWYASAITSLSERNAVHVACFYYFITKNKTDRIEKE